MIEPGGFGDGAMNLLELILLAALSGGIVAVSLRLRPSTPSTGMWPEGDRLSKDRLSKGDPQPTRKAVGSRRPKNPFSLRGEADSIVR